MMQPPRMGGLLQVNICDRAMLQSSYMPFIQGGALFIPSTQAVEMGQNVFVLASMPNQTQKIPLTGKVVWISYKQSAIKPQGFAIQLTGEKGSYFRIEAEKFLAGTLSSDLPGFTM